MNLIVGQAVITLKIVKYDTLIQNFKIKMISTLHGGIACY